MIDTLSKLHPAVACTLVIAGAVVIGVLIYNYFRWLRSIM
jgi:hypothetical protein